MVDSDSDQESTPVRSKPQDFIANYSDEEKSLCHIDEHLNLHQHSVQLYTPEGYLELPGSAETYEVVSIPNDEQFYEEGDSEPVVKSKLTRRTVTRTQPITSESTSSSSDTEADPRLRNTGPITSSTDSSNTGSSGYSGDVDSESEVSRVNQHRKLVESDDSDQYSCKSITPIISHRVFCNAITRWQHHCPIPLPMIVIPQCGVRIINCQLHCRGLDRDFYERNATFTGVVKFSQNSMACSSSHTCIVELDVKVYEGRMDLAATVHDEPSLLGAAKERRKLSKQEREECVMHITVHKVVKLDAIVYHETCPNISVVTLQITASVQTVRNDDNQEYDSGCIGASRSSGTES